MKEYKVEVHENGTRYWFINDKLHREDGPAIEYANGGNYWYIEGEGLTEEEFNNRNKVELTLEDIAKVMNIDVDALRIIIRLWNNN